MENQANRLGPRSRPARLLIVDDNPVVVEGLAAHVAGQGYECITALSGHQAIQFMDDPGIDALITDLDMPYLDGFALISLATSLKPCKCVTITGSADSATRCYDGYPGVAVIMKPFETERIVSALRKTQPISPD